MTDKSFEIHRFAQLLVEAGYNMTLSNPLTQRMLVDAASTSGANVQVVDPATREQWLVELRKDPKDAAAPEGLFIMPVSAHVLQRDPKDRTHVHSIRVDVQSLREVLAGHSGNPTAEQAFITEIENALAHNMDVLVVDPSTGDRYRVTADQNGTYKFEAMGILAN